MKKEELRAGLKINCTDSFGRQKYIKILAIAEGYVMCRYKGAMPFVKSINDFIELVNKITTW